MHMIINMPKVYWHFATVKAGKSLDLLRVDYTYKDQDKKTLLVMPARNTRDGVGVTRSRAGFERKVDVLVSSADDIRKIETKGVACVFVEEAQFLPDEASVLALVEMSRTVPVMCYGLRTDFLGKLFPAAGWLFAHSHVQREIITTCIHRSCNRKAIYNMRVDAKGRKVTHGDVVVLGDDYLPVCHEHYASWEVAPVESAKSGGAESDDAKTESAAPVKDV